MAAPIHERLRADLAARIRDGVWAEGEPIPSETRLCEEFGVSRGPVRQALARLRAEGLIVGGRGRPPRVARGVPSQPVDVFVSFSAWAAGAGLHPGQRTIEIARRASDETMAARMDIAPGDPVVSLLRLRTLAGDPVMIERTTWIDAAGRHLFDMDTDSGSTNAYLISQGIDLFAATHVLDAVAADETDAELLNLPVGSPLLRECRTTVDAGGVVLEYSDDRYLPSRANFVIHNQRATSGPLYLIDPEASANPTQP